MNKSVLLGAAVALVAIGWFGREAAGLGSVPREERAAEPVAVAVVAVTNAVFNPPREYIGHVEPAQVTDILPQIDGYIRRVCFSEGTVVNKGDLLFEIDEEQYEAAKNLRYSEIASAEARVIVAQAEVDRAERYYARLTSADERGVTATERDTAETTLSSAKAALNAANAAVGQARAAAAIADFNLRHTKVYSPISGQIGKALHHVGDYVAPSKSYLARVVQTDPMRVVFPVNDRESSAWRSGPHRRLRLVLPDGSIYDRDGELEFGDNEMNRQSATLTMFASFPNPEGRLVANAYVRILADESEPREALVVPAQALTRTDDGLKAWKIGDGMRVYPVDVTVDGEWNGMFRVAGGLEAGDRIVGGGAFRLNEGDVVKVVAP